MGEVADFLAELSETYPEDAEDLQDVAATFQKQKITSLDRLARLSEGQWQRMNIPIGIESVIKEELEALLAPEQEQKADDEDEIPIEEFEPSRSENRHRGGGSGRQETQIQESGMRNRKGGAKPKEKAEKGKGLLSSVDLTPPDDLEQLWAQLLSDTLPPDKRSALQESWEQCGNDQDKYMMFLEYSSYLRKPEITEEDKEERKKRMEEMKREFGIKYDEEENGWGGVILWLVAFGITIFIAGAVYYTYSQPAGPAHDSQSL